MNSGARRPPVRLVCHGAMRMGKLQTITFLAHQRVSFVLRLRQSFPEDCARLKLSSTRASQAATKEMMMQTKSEGCGNE